MQTIIIPTFISDDAEPVVGTGSFLLVTHIDSLGPDEVTDLLREWCKGYVQTGDGQDYAHDNNVFAFNWGDLATVLGEVQAIPGIIKIEAAESTMQVVVVDHDEMLAAPDMDVVLGITLLEEEEDDEYDG